PFPFCIAWQWGLDRSSCLELKGKSSSRSKGLHIVARMFGLYGSIFLTKWTKNNPICDLLVCCHDNPTETRSPQGTGMDEATDDDVLVRQALQDAGAFADTFANAFAILYRR